MGRKRYLIESGLVIIWIILFYVLCGKIIKSKSSVQISNEIINNAECCFDNQNETVRVNCDEMISKYKKGYTTARVRIREQPSLDANIIQILDFNTEVNVCEYNKDWLSVKIDENQYYISNDFVSNKNPDNELFDISYVYTSGFKSYMSYNAITDTTSKQYKLQKEMAYTGTYGIRQINNRFCIAIGTYFNSSIGDYVDLVLANGEIIPCVVSDIKADKDTDINNIMTMSNGCVSEFIVDIGSLNCNAKKSGTISSCKLEWDSKVIAIRLYKYNILEK